MWDNLFEDVYYNVVVGVLVVWWVCKCLFLWCCEFPYSGGPYRSGCGRRVAAARR